MRKEHNPNDKVIVHTKYGGAFESTWAEYQESLQGADGVELDTGEIEPNKESDIKYNDFDRRISSLASTIRHSRSDTEDYSNDIKKLLSELRKYIKNNPNDTRMKKLLNKLQTLQKGYKKGWYE